MPTIDPIPRQYRIAINTASHRVNTATRAQALRAKQRLTSRGIKGDRPATIQDIRFARHVAQNANTSVFRDVAKVLTMNRYDAATAAVNLHDLAPVLRSGVLNQLATAMPSYLDDSALARTSMDVAGGWLDTLIGNLASSGDSITAGDVLNAIVGWIDPSDPGGLSYAADRLVMDQLSNTFHDAQIETADVQNIATVFWRLDAGHDIEDECDDYADEEFNVDEVPDLPHIGCLCWLEPGQSPDEAAAQQDNQDQTQEGDVADQNQAATDEMNAATIKGAVEVPLTSTPDVVQGWAEKVRQDAGSDASVRVMQTPSGGYTYHVFK